MSINKGMFTSTTDMWETPQEFFDRWDAVYHFDLDVCAIPENAKCKQYFTPEQDALQQEWNGVCWMNPPYGREIGRWVKKAYESAQKMEQPSYACCPQGRIQHGGMITVYTAILHSYVAD